MQNLGARAAFADGPLLAVVAEFFPHDAFEKWDDARDLGEDAVGRVVGLRDAHAVHDVHDDLAVGLRAGERRDDFVHALHAALAIREGAALFKERRTGQHDVRELRDFAVRPTLQSLTLRKTTKPNVLYFTMPVKPCLTASSWSREGSS